MDSSLYLLGERLYIIYIYAYIYIHIYIYLHCEKTITLAIDTKVKKESTEVKCIAPEIDCAGHKVKYFK
jgi:hypothetical protein